MIYPEGIGRCPELIRSYQLWEADLVISSYWTSCICCGIPWWHSCHYWDFKLGQAIKHLQFLSFGLIEQCLARMSSWYPCYNLNLHVVALPRPGSNSVPFHSSPCAEQVVLVCLLMCVLQPLHGSPLFALICWLLPQFSSLLFQLVSLDM